MAMSIIFYIFLQFRHYAVWIGQEIMGASFPCRRREGVASKGMLE
jgi:hypothetical protein